MNQQLDPAALLALMQQMQQQLADQQDQLLRLSSQQRPEPRFHLPDPPRFDGKPFTLRIWLPAIQAKIAADQLQNQQAFDYVYNRLEPPQQASILHLRDNSASGPDQIFEYFQRICHNPREKQENILRFTNIRQKEEESLIAYIARFERFAHQADIKLYNIELAVFVTTTLHRGLRYKLRDTVEQTNDTIFNLTYNEYLALLQTYDRRQPRNQPPRQLRLPAPAASKEKSIRFEPEPMDISVNRTRIKPDSVQKRDTVKLSQPPDQRTSAARWNRRAKNDTCYYCGSFNHYIKECPWTENRTASPTSTISDSDSNG